MAFRRRFTAQEKKDFTVGTVVEWQNGGHWHPGEIIGLPYQDSVTNCWHVIVKHTGRNTASISKGQRIDSYPGKVRLPS